MKHLSHEHMQACKKCIEVCEQGINVCQKLIDMCSISLTKECAAECGKWGKNLR